MIKPQRGEVWMAQLDPVRGHEQAKTRPCIIVSTDQLNNGRHGLVIAVPITSRSKGQFFHVYITPPNGGLLTPSYVLCEQIRVLSHDRLSEKPLGMVDSETLNDIESMLRIILDLGI